MTNLHWLLLSLFLSAAPHYSHLPPWTIGLCLALGGWRAAIERRGGALPKRWLLLLIAALIVGSVLYRYRTLLGRDPGVAFLVSLIALKTLELRTKRDATILIFLSYFLIAANFLYSQSIPAALYLIPAMLATTATLIGYNDVNGVVSGKARLRLGGALLVQGIPLMLVLFVLFPRVSPLWGLPRDAFGGLTGLSDRMAPGEISELIQSDAIAFRARFDGPPPPRRERYWRAMVLWDFDGKTWLTRSHVPASPPAAEFQGEATRYTVTLEPHNRLWLFALDLPSEAPPESRIDGDFQLRSRVLIQQRMRYAVTSHLDYRMGLDLGQSERRRALSLPPDANPQSRALAADWLAKTSTPEQVVGRALGMFREQPFYYTLNPPPLGPQGVDEFLFETRRGFCEHYAGAFVFLMRAANIPARVVVGYQGGEDNPLGDYTIVRQSDAHAWAEVWLAGKGWVRIDPTGAVSPSRIESGISSALPPGEMPLGFAQGDLAWLRQLRLSWDVLNNNWNQWVLGYGEERQRRFLGGLSPSLATWQGMATALASALGILVAGIAAWVLRFPRRSDSDAALAAYRRFCAKLARRGIVRRPDEGPHDFAARVAALRPELARRVLHITRLYSVVRYGNRPGHLAALRRAIRRFRT